MDPLLNQNVIGMRQTLLLLLSQLSISESAATAAARSRLTAPPTIRPLVKYSHLPSGLTEASPSSNAPSPS